MPHYFVVEKLGEDEFARWIEHEKECAEAAMMQKQYDYPCKIGGYVAWAGFEDLTLEPEYETPGRYEIDLYENYSDSYFSDSEVYLEIVKNDRS